MLQCEMWSSKQSIFDPASYERKQAGGISHAPLAPRPSAADVPTETLQAWMGFAEYVFELLEFQIQHPKPNPPQRTHNGLTAARLDREGVPGCRRGGTVEESLEGGKGKKGSVDSPTVTRALRSNLGTFQPLMDRCVSMPQSYTKQPPDLSLHCSKILVSPYLALPLANTMSNQATPPVRDPLLKIYLATSGRRQSCKSMTARSSAQSRHHWAFLGFFFFLLFST